MRRPSRSAGSTRLITAWPIGWTWRLLDLADESADWSPRYDLVLLIECVHDFPRPVEALRHARAAVRPGGTVLVVDERAAETLHRARRRDRALLRRGQRDLVPSAGPGRPRPGAGRHPHPPGSHARSRPPGGLRRRARSCRSSTRPGGSTGWSRERARWPGRDRDRHVLRAWPAVRGGAGRRGRPRRPRLPPASGRPRAGRAAAGRAAGGLRRAQPRRPRGSGAGRYRPFRPDRHPGQQRRGRVLRPGGRGEPGARAGPDRHEPDRRVRAHPARRPAHARPAAAG